MVNFGQRDENADEKPGLLAPFEGKTSIDGQVDAEGIPIDRSVSGWLDLFDPTHPLDPRVSRWLQAVLRYSRADGSPVFGPRGRSTERLGRLAQWLARLGDPSLAAVVKGWSPARSISTFPPSPPPTPSDSRPDRVLAVLRPDWSLRGDLVAIDHRRIGDESLVEVTARGRTWLGASWTSGPSSGKFSIARPTHWTSGVFADCCEWSYKVGAARVTRTALLLRGRSMALLGQQDDGRGPSSEIRLSLGEGIEAKPVEGSRALLLSSGRGQPTARLIPLGLPHHDRPTEAGSIAVEGREVVIRQHSEGRRRWLPVLVCWGKPPTIWRASTVAFRSKACRGDIASAARVAWGPRDDGLVVYRSLGPPALRSFLGHQSGARFLAGTLNRAGDVRPILKLET